MEDILIFAIIAISIVANVISNFRKEAKKNANRTIGQPVKTTSTSTQQKGQSQSVKKTYKKPEESLESIFSLEEIAPKEEDYTKKKAVKLPVNEIDDISEADYTISSIENEIAEEDKNTSSSINEIFKTKDDFKKAILYSTILERKF